MFVCVCMCLSQYPAHIYDDTFRASSLVATICASSAQEVARPQQSAIFGYDKVMHRIGVVGVDHCARGADQRRRREEGQRSRTKVKSHS